MKSFLLKFGVFVLIVVAILATMGWAMFGIEKRAYYDTLRLAPEDKYIAIGDSRSEQSLDPSIIKGLRNMSLAGSQIAVWEARLRDLAALNDDGVRRTIIIEASPLQFVVSREHRAREYEYDRAILWMLHPELRAAAEFDNLYLRYVKNEFPIRLLQLMATKVRHGLFRSVLQGGFSKPPECSGYSDAEITQQVVGKKNVLRHFKFEEQDQSFLRPIAEVCAKQGWSLVVLTFPICDFNPESELMRQFRADLAGFCAQHSAHYIDLTDLCRERKCWLDAVHVSSAGMQIISRRINELMNARDGK